MRRREERLHELVDRPRRARVDEEDAPASVDPDRGREKRRSDGAQTLRRSQETIRMDCTSVP